MNAANQGYGSISGGQAAMQQTSKISPPTPLEIEAEMSRLDAQANHLRQRLETLIDRLEKVCAPSTPTANPENGSSSAASALGQGIREQSMQIERMIRRVGDVLDRLAI